MPSKQASETAPKPLTLNSCDTSKVFEEEVAAKQIPDGYSIVGMQDTTVRQPLSR